MIDLSWFVENIYGILFGYLYAVFMVALIALVYLIKKDRGQA